MTNLDTQYKLSKREIEITQELIMGLRNKQIANKLFITEKTVKFHLTNIYKKMGVSSRSQLIVKIMVTENNTVPSQEETDSELPIAHV